MLLGLAMRAAGVATGGGSLPIIATLVALVAVSGVGSCMARDARIRQEGASVQIGVQLRENAERERDLAERRRVADQVLADSDVALAEQIAAIDAWASQMEGRVLDLEAAAWPDKPGHCVKGCIPPQLEVGE